MNEAGQNFESREVWPEQEPDEKSYTFEIKDKQGRTLGTAEVSLSGALVEIDRRGEKYRGQTLKTFIISGGKEGQKIDLDVLQMANTHQAKIIIDEGERRENSGYFYLPPDQIFAPMPRTPIDISTLLHELGHSDQMRGTADEVNKLNLSINGVNRPQSIEARLKEIPKVIPETALVVEEIIKQGDFQKLVALEKKIKQMNDLFDAQQAEIKKKQEKMGYSIYQRYNIAPPYSKETLAKLELSAEELATEAEIDSFFEEVKKLYEKEGQKNGLLGKHPEYLELLKLPAKLLERDANRRAIQWMLEIRKKTGINLLSVDTEVVKKIPETSTEKNSREAKITDRIFSFLEKIRQTFKSKTNVGKDCTTTLTPQFSSASSVSKWLGESLGTYEAKTITLKTASGIAVTPRLPK